jgi:hypothetical protein
MEREDTPFSDGGTEKPMNTVATIESMPQAEFEKSIQEYIAWAATWDGSLPPDVFFGVWADIQQEKKPLELKAHVVHGRLIFTLPPGSPIKAADNSIYLEDGRELIVHLESVT